MSYDSYSSASCLTENTDDQLQFFELDYEPEAYFEDDDSPGISRLGN